MCARIQLKILSELSASEPVSASAVAMVVSCKLNVCRITVASRLFARNDYFPLLRVTTPAEAARERCPDGVYRPRIHYMPVLLNSRSRVRKKGKPRLHSSLEGFRYMLLVLEGRLLELLESRPPCRLAKGLYAYRVEDRQTCLLLDARLEEAARSGDVADLTIADHADRTLLRLRQGERMPATAVDYVVKERVYEGEARTTKEMETRHHYGKATMAIASIFESKERAAALEKLQQIQARAKRIKRQENEWKNGMATLIANLQHKGNAVQHNETNTKLANGLRLHNIEKTLDAAEKLQSSGHLEKLPPIGRVDFLVRHALSNGQQCELAGTTGALVNDCDGQQYFIVGQTIDTTNGGVFVPGLTFQKDSIHTYMAGMCVLVHDAPAFVAGAVFADDHEQPVFLPGQLIIAQDGTAEITSNEIATCAVLQLQGEERRQRVHRVKVQRKKLRREKEKKHKENEHRNASVEAQQKKEDITDNKSKENVISNEEPINKIDFETDKEKIDKQNNVMNMNQKNLLNSEIDSLNTIKDTTFCDHISEEKILINKTKNFPEDVTAVVSSKNDSVQTNLNVNSIEQNKPIELFDSASEITRATVKEKIDARNNNQSESTDQEMVTDTNVSIPSQQQNSQSETIERRTDVEMLSLYEEEIRKGVFLEEHDTHILNLEKQKEKDRQRLFQMEHEKIARVGDDMNEVIDSLELKKRKLLEKLRDIQTETYSVPERSVTYIYPAKANALALEIGLDGRSARAAAKLLLSVTRWASGFSSKFKIREENVPAQPGELDLPSSEEVLEGSDVLSGGLRTALRASMAAAVRVFRSRPRDLEAGMRAAGKELARVINESDRPLLQELTTAVLSRTGQETNAIMSDTISELTKKVCGKF